MNSGFPELSAVLLQLNRGLAHSTIDKDRRKPTNGASGARPFLRSFYTEE
jgi:hypothetical protein